MSCVTFRPHVLLLLLLLLLFCSLHNGQLLRANPGRGERGFSQPPSPSPSPAKAAVLSVSEFFNSSMVLQRAPHSARMWGSAAAGSTVSITIDSEEAVHGTADATGYWLITLPPHPARMGHTLQVASGGESILFADVSFGDVYLCSGQSNMQVSHTGPTERTSTQSTPLLLITSSPLSCSVARS